MKRRAGVLLPVFSLPSKYGIGCFDDAAYAFVDWLADARQTYWQILPLTAPVDGVSPYTCCSAFAGNPYFIDLGAFVKEGSLTDEECRACQGDDPKRIDYTKLQTHRMALLHKAYEYAKAHDDARYAISKPTFKAFVTSNTWIKDYALFNVIKDSLDGERLPNWPDDLRLRDITALNEREAALSDEMTFYYFIQYVFQDQWHALKHYANDKGIKIIGDIPIYIAENSSDFWVNPELFQTNDDKRISCTSGFPPDAFSKDGQIWDNPLYDWPVHKQTGFTWWINRMAQAFEIYDIVRIDHFRGFETYYSIDAKTRNAHTGHWEKGPGMDLFNALKQSLGDHEILAEDLGKCTKEVQELVRQSGFATMRVLQFGFGKVAEDIYLPHNYPDNSVAYTGTHDNETIMGWYESLDEKSVSMLNEYLCQPDVDLSQPALQFIGLVMRSSSAYAIIPLQDWLALGNESRINIPGTVRNNWEWRAEYDYFSAELSQTISHLSRLTSRTSDYATEDPTVEKVSD